MVMVTGRALNLPAPVPRNDNGRLAQDLAWSLVGVGMLGFFGALALAVAKGAM